MTPTPPRRRFTGSVAAAAALLIVALIVVVLARGLTNRPGTLARHTATATTIRMQTPTPAPTPGNNFSGSQGIWTAISPTNPQVIYENTLYGDSLSRSSDGGKTFTKLPLPSNNMLYPWFYVAVSPLDPNHVIASGTGGCPSGNSQTMNKAPLAMPLSGGPHCSQSFFSADGGQTWNLLTLPFSGVIFSPVILHQLSSLNPTSATLQAQGTRLYAIDGASVSGIDSGPVRLIVSDDDGASWQSADNGLGSAICDFAPAPTGATVYAITTATVCTHYTATQPDLTLMRSNDGGASWAAVTTLPTVTDLGMFVTTDGALYINMPKSTSSTPHFAFSPDSFIVSRDGGQTFSRSPLAGAPAGDMFEGPGAELSDGSILAVAYDTTGMANGVTTAMTMTCYTWRAGDSSWRKISPTFAVEISDIVVVSQQGSDAVYFADANGVITHFTV